MSVRTTIVLALLLAAASVVAWIDFRTQTPRSTPAFLGLGEDRENAPPGESITHLFDFAPASVTSVEVQRGTFTARATRTAAGWTGNAAPAVVDDFLTSMRQLAEIMVMGSDAGGARDYGLDPPAAIIRLERPGAAPIVLRLGNSNPASTGVYAQVDDGAVVLTGALAMWELDKLVRAMQGTRGEAHTETTTNAENSRSSDFRTFHRTDPTEVRV